VQTALAFFAHLTVGVMQAMIGRSGTQVPRQRPLDLCSICARVRLERFAAKFAETDTLVPDPGRTTDSAFCITRNQLKRCGGALDLSSHSNELTELPEAESPHAYQAGAVDGVITDLLERRLDQAQILSES
jgi:hypothetical protein